MLSMHSGNYAELTEHFVTLFDSNYLPMGICLHDSLMEHASPFHLWILCMDELVERQLRQMDLAHVSLIPLRAVETDALLRVKSERSRAEYCWTLTPFTPQFVFEQDDKISRVTYLDADLLFFDSPLLLIKELDESSKDVLITPHGYAPEYDCSETSGTFCVQFLTFRRTSGGTEVMRWWQDRCIEWCFHRCEGGKMGDQKYLEDWPTRFANEVHVLRQTDKTLAPWNVSHFFNRYPLNIPVFYHFHTLRIISDRRVRLYSGYNIGRGNWIYDTYWEKMKSAFSTMEENGMKIPTLPLPKEKLYVLRRIKRALFKEDRYEDIQARRNMFCSAEFALGKRGERGPGCE